ncbi:hypothetical protein ACWEWK_22335 [Streptomyces sp. NPDC003757]
MELRGPNGRAAGARLLAAGATGALGGPVTAEPPDRRARAHRRLRHRVLASGTGLALDTPVTRGGPTSVRVVPAPVLVLVLVPGRRTGAVHIFPARSGGPTPTRERAQ